MDISVHMNKYINLYIYQHKYTCIQTKRSKKEYFCMGTRNFLTGSISNNSPYSFEYFRLFPVEDMNGNSSNLLSKRFNFSKRQVSNDPWG